MRKLALLTVATAAIVAAASTPLFSEAAVKTVSSNSLSDNCRVIIGGKACSQEELEAILEDLGSAAGNCTWSRYIKSFVLSGCELPTETPDNSMPDSGITETPDSDTEDSGTTETPDNNTGDAGTTETPDSENLSFAEQVVKLVNEERTKAGLKEVTLDTNIETAALVRAKEIEKSFSHTRPDGRHFSTALREQNVNYKGAGENIAWGQSSPEAVMNAWMNSEGHRANILNPNYTKIGVGYYQNAKGTNYWTQLFTY